MATEDLLVNIEVDADKAVNSLEKYEEIVESNERQSRQLEKALMSIIKSFDRVSKQVKKTDGNLEANQKLMKDTEKAYKESAKSLDAFATSFDTVSNAVAGASEAFQDLVSTTNNVLEVIEKLTNPDLLIRLSRLALVISTVARVKGLSGTAAGLRSVSEALAQGAVFFSEFREEGELTLESLAKRASTIQKIQDTISTFGSIIATLGVVGFVSGINDVLVEFGVVTKSVSKPLNQLPIFINKIIEPFGNLGKNVKQVSDAFRQVTRDLFLLTRTSATVEELLNNSTKAVESFQGAIFVLADVLEESSGNLIKGFKNISSLVGSVSKSATRSIKNMSSSVTKAFKENATVMLAFREILKGVARPIGDSLVPALENLVLLGVKFRMGAGSLFAVLSDLGLQFRRLGRDLGRDFIKTLTFVPTLLNTFALNIKNVFSVFDPTRAAITQFLETLGKFEQTGQMFKNVGNDIVSVLWGIGKQLSLIGNTFFTLAKVTIGGVVVNAAGLLKATFEGIIFNAKEVRKSFIGFAMPGIRGMSFALKEMAGSFSKELPQAFRMYSAALLQSMGVTKKVSLASVKFWDPFRDTVSQMPRLMASVKQTFMGLTPFIEHFGDAVVTLGTSLAFGVPADITFLLTALDVSLNGLFTGLARNVQLLVLPFNLLEKGVKKVLRVGILNAFSGIQNVKDLKTAIGNLKTSFLDLGDALTSLIPAAFKSLNNVVTQFLSTGFVEIPRRIAFLVSDTIKTVTDVLILGLTDAADSFKIFATVSSAHLRSFSTSAVDSFMDIGKTIAAIDFGAAVDTLAAGLNNTARGLRAFGRGFAVGFLSPIAAAKSASKVFGNVLSGVTIPSLITMAEVGGIAGPALLAVGRAASESEDALIKFSGIAAVIAGVTLAGLTTGMVFFLDIIGSVAERIGDKLLGAMTEFEQKFQKAEVGVKSFEFALTNFSEVVGAEVVGTFDLWSAKVSQAAKNTTLGGAELRKGTQLLVSEIQAVGLSLGQAEQIFTRAVDLAVAKEKDFAEVIGQVINGITGQSQAVLSLGVNINEHAIEHSKFTKALQKEGIALDENTKQVVRFNEIMKQTAPFVGFAAQAVNTIAGANRQYEKALGSVQAALGEQSDFTIAYLVSLTKLAESFLALPKSILTATGTFIDFGGVILKVGGIVTQYILIISSLTTAYSLLNAGIEKSIFLSTNLETALNFASQALGGKAVQVNSLKDVLSSMAGILAGGLKKALQSFWMLIWELVKGIGALSVKLLKSPFFLKGVFLIGVFTSLGKAIGEVTSELKELEKQLESSNKDAKEAKSLWESLAPIFTRISKAFVQVVKIIVSGALAIIEYVKLVGLGYQKLWATIKDDRGALEELRVKSIAVTERLSNLGNIAGKSLLNVTMFFEESAQAAEKKLGPAIDKITNKIRGFSEALNKLSFDPKSLRISVLGTDLEKAAESFRLANEALNIARSGSGVEGDDGKMRAATEKEIAQLQLDRATKALEFEKLRIDAFEGIKKREKELSQQLARSGKSELDNIRFAASEEIKALERRKKALGAFVGLRKDELNNIEDLKRAVKALADAEAERTKAKLQEDYLKFLEQQADAADKLKSRVRDLQIQNLQAAGDIMGVQDLLTEKRMEELDSLEKTVKQMAAQGAITGKVRDQYLAVIDAAKKLAETTNGIKMPELFTGKQVQEIKFVFGDGAGDAAALVSSMMAAPLMFMKAADIILDAILKLINFIPEFINKVADVFKALTDFPKMLTKAVKNLGREFLRFLTDFIPNLIKSFGDVFETILDTLAIKLPEILVKLPDMIVGAFNKLLDRAPELALKFGLALVNMNWTVLALKFAAGIIQALPKIWKTLLRFIFQSIPQIAEGIANGIILAMKQLVNDFARGLGLGDIFNIEMPDVAGELEAIGKKVTEESSKLFAVLDLEAEARGLNRAKEMENIFNFGIRRFLDMFRQFMKFLTDKWVMFTGWLGDRFDAFISGVSEAFTWIKENILDPILNGFKTVFMWINDNVFQPIITFFTDLGPKIKEAWDPIVGVFTDFKEMVTGAFDPIVSMFNNLKTTVPAAFKSVLDAFKNLGTNIWNGFKEAFKTADTLFSGWGGKIWDGLKTGLGNISTVIKEQLDKVNPANLFGKMFDSANAFGKTGVVEDFLKIDVPFLQFSRGGQVPGRALFGGDDPRNDTVLSLLSPGEAVIPRSAMSNPLIKGMVDAILNGVVPKFAVGGIVGEKIDQATGGAWSDAWSSIGINEGDFDLLSAIGVSLDDVQKFSRIPGLGDPVEFFGKLGEDGLARFRDFTTQFGNVAIQGLTTIRNAILKGNLPGMEQIWKMVRDSVLGRMIPQMLATNSFHNGGLVGMAYGGNVPAMLEGGEYVINKEAVRGLGLNFLNQVNRGQQPTVNQGDITLNLTIEGSREKLDEAFVRTRLMPTIKNELKRSSMRGDFLLSQRGIRDT